MNAGMRFGPLCAAVAIATAGVFADVPRIIFDTDMYTDYDDVGALAMLHAFADAGECRIAAIGCDTYGEGNQSVAECEIVNAYYGRGDITVGCARSGGVCGKGAEGHGLPARYPEYVRHSVSTNAPPAVEVYVRALEGSPDKSVVLCSVGFLNNVADLLRIAPGLVSRKVRLWVCMACSYPDGKEYNSMRDPASSAYAFEHWPKDVPIVWTDFQYGRTCYAGRAVAELPDTRNPVRDVFNGHLTPRDKVVPGESWDQLAGHPSWDETAMLIAVRGWERYFTLRRGNHRMIGTDGANEWTDDPDSINGRVDVAPDFDRAAVAALMDSIMCRKPLNAWK